jgi:hypothetical protein
LDAFIFTGGKKGSIQEGKSKKNGGGGVSNGKAAEGRQPQLKHPIFDKFLSQGRQHVARIR